MFDYLLRASAVVNDLSFTHLHEPPRPNTGNPVPRGTPAIRQVRRPHSCSTQNSGMIVPFAPGFGKRGILFIQPNVRVGVSVCQRIVRLVLRTLRYRTIAAPAERNSAAGKAIHTPFIPNARLSRYAAGRITTR